MQWYALPNVFRHLRGVLRGSEGSGGGECSGGGCGVASVDAGAELKPPRRCARSPAKRLRLRVAVSGKLIYKERHMCCECDIQLH